MRVCERPVITTEGAPKGTDDKAGAGVGEGKYAKPRRKAKILDIIATSVFKTTELYNHNNNKTIKQTK